MPFVSVIVPVYNVENVLHFCIESVLSQTYEDYELILVDDGSLDSSGKICDEYADKDTRIRVLHIKNGGVSAARNRGIKESRGKYICFVDSDDYIDRKYLEVLLKTKEQNAESDNIWCYHETTDTYDTVFIDNNHIETSLFSTKDIMSLHEKWLDAGPVCKLYCREIINANGLRFDEELSLGEDIVFNYQYLDCTNKNITVIELPLYHYVTLKDDSLSSKYYSDLRSIYDKIYSVIFFYLKKWSCDKVQWKKYYNACFYKNELILRNTFHPDCMMTKKQKYKFNNGFMKSKEFIDVYNKTDCFIHPLYRFAYYSGKYRMVQLVDWLTRFKK